jgi:translocation and assembly module TamA
VEANVVNKGKKSLLFWLILGFETSLARAGDQVLCPHFVLRSPFSISLSETERRLVCGDPHNEAWDNIPENQAMFALRNFLQDRGYYSVKLLHEEGRRIADAGKPTYVTKLTAHGYPKPLDRWRRVEGELLTPKFLDSLQERFTSNLRSNGYPCPKVSMRGNPLTGEVSAEVASGPHESILALTQEPVEGLDVQVLRRYDAFLMGKPFNQDFITLTEDRITRAGILQSTHFGSTCLPEGVHLHQTAVSGPPRSLTFGFGVDTERLIRVRGSWSHLRLGRQGSRIELSANASFKEQQFTTTADWYYLGVPTRHYLKPLLSLRHRNEDPFEDLEANIELGPTITAEDQFTGFTFSAGPRFNWIHTFRSTTTQDSGVAPGVDPVSTLTDEYFSSISVQARATSHYWEFYRNRNSPQEGFDISLFGNFTQRGILSDVTAQLLNLNFEHLWNLFGYQPSFLIFGVRGRLATTLAPGEEIAADLTPNFRHYLGGSQTLRGFGRNEIDGRTMDQRGYQGSLTSAYASFELRLNDVLPWRLQPFVFFDLGVLGSQPLIIDSPVFWSPGFGTRWETKFGIFRGYAAHGFAAGNSNDFRPGLSHWQFQLDYGEEF